MKKLYILLVVALIGFVGVAQIVNIPDANFKAKLLAASATTYIAYNYSGVKIKIDTNNDGNIQASEALLVYQFNLVSSNIADLTGIASFTNLRNLSCNNNQLTALNLQGLTNLQYLDCNANQLALLNVQGLINLINLNCNNNLLTSLNTQGLTSLSELQCEYNQLTSLNVQGLTNLHILKCRNNQLPTLNAQGLTNLQTLECYYNQLPTLNVQGLTTLVILNCSNNQLPTLNVQGLTNLSTLNCMGNQLSDINVQGLLNLHAFYCDNNLLSSLNLQGLNIEELSCSNNLLPELNVQGLAHLRILTCNNNQLTILDVHGLTTLQWLYCHYNQLTTLDLQGLPNFYVLKCNNNQLISLFIKNGVVESTLNFYNNPNLEYVCCDELQVSAVLLTISGQMGYNLNTVVNSYCSFTPGGTFYTIQGDNRYDENANGCAASDPFVPNLKLSITNGSITGTVISNATGNANNSVQAGTYTITPVLENPTYFNCYPTSATITFPTTASPFGQNFCLSPNGSHPDLEVTIVPLDPIVLISGTVSYRIIYKNKGTITQSGSVNLLFNDPALDLVFALPTADTQTSNNLTWNFTNLHPFETRVISLTFDTFNPPLYIGGNLDYTATITSALIDETPDDNVMAIRQTGDVACIYTYVSEVAGNTLALEMAGKYVHYVIGFENTGTATIQNTVVKDLIDISKFDISTLQITDTSHTCTTKITSPNKVEFIFQNINLPFVTGKNVNSFIAGTNTGHVAFKIKTLPTLVDGDTFSNSASIFFDYNAPIVTNTATTTIAALATQDFDFSSYFSIYPNPAEQLLNLETKAAINVTSINIYNLLGQMVITIPNAESVSTIDVSDLTTGTYFIKVNTDKGTANAKFVKE